MGKTGSPKKKKDAVEEPPPNTTYKTFILAGERFTIGDNMLIKGTGKGTADYVAKLEKISTNQAGEVYLDTRWYYRPEETAMGRQPWHGAEEVIESDHKDSYHVRCVNSKCNIISLPEYEALPMAKKKKKAVDGKPDLPVFFSRSYYLRDKKRLREPLPKYCFCQQPSNPDKTLLMCDNCGDWFHGDCVNVTPQMANSLDIWHCPGCTGKGPPSKKSKKN